MKKCLFILFSAVSLLVMADDFIDDVYFSQNTAIKQQLSSENITPKYNKANMQELTFVQDSIPVDTVSQFVIP